MSLTIRAYTEQDEDALAELLAELIGHMATIDRMKLFQPREKLEGRTFLTVHLEKVAKEHGKILIALWGDVPVGHLIASIEEPSAFRDTYQIPQKHGVIDSLYVREGYRGKGISTALVADIENYFRTQECTHVTVGALFVNEPAKAFYRKQGYQEQYVDFFKKL